MSANSSADLLDTATVLSCLQRRVLVSDESACRAHEGEGSVSRVVNDVKGPKSHLFANQSLPDCVSSRSGLEVANKPSVNLAGLGHAGSCTEATWRLDERVKLIGDDLYVTSVASLERGIADGVANAIRVKPNQCGPLTDSRAALESGGEATYATIVFARSGDTEDASLADLAVGRRSAQVKVGSTVRFARTAKLNRLLKIKAGLRERGAFAGSPRLGAAVRP